MNSKAPVAQLDRASDFGLAGHPDASADGAPRSQAREHDPVRAGSALRPFWRYYGGKYRAAPHYPKPQHKTIVEPFAGAAGYSLRYPDLDVILIEKYPTVAAIWRWLIAVDPQEVRAIPEVDSVDDLPEWVPQPARQLVGFSMNSACSTPRRTLSAGRRRLRAMHRQFEGWTPALRERVASQVTRIRHWQIIEDDYTAAPDIEATWFVDPPYDGSGRHYVHHRLDYRALAGWCRTRSGQVIVCENEGASWLPFERFQSFKAANGRTSREALWVGGYRRAKALEMFSRRTP